MLRLRTKNYLREPRAARITHRAGNSGEEDLHSHHHAEI